MLLEPFRHEHLRAIERWIASVRLIAVVFAIVEITVFTSGIPAGYDVAAWATSAVFAVGSVVLFWLSRRGKHLVLLGLAALAFDIVIISAYALIFSYEYGSPTRWALMFAVVEGALRYGLWGGVGVAIALIPIFAFAELWRAHHFGPPGFVADRVSFPAGMHLLLGLIVGWLVAQLDSEAVHARERAQEAEVLRDELGRRVDTLEAVNRCARALASSLELETAFAGFIRELRGLVPFARTTILLAERDAVQVIAVAGLGAEGVYGKGSHQRLAGSLMEEVLQTAQLVARADMLDGRYPEEAALVELGLRSRLAAPLFAAGRTIGMLSISREEPDAFSPAEEELVALLSRIGGHAVQNIRAYESERENAAELRRLSALRADFVALVSHELRSPMAAVIGSARTLQQRWRQLSPEQRDAFLTLIADETERLTTLIGDVLDTSRIEAGTFSYSFSEVDMGRVIRDAATAADLAQDEVSVRARVIGVIQPIRGDGERLRQVVTNMIDNAVKYSPAGKLVDVSASSDDQAVRVDVRDTGPGIPAEQHGLIFEKFGRAHVAGAKATPGTGLGLFIARSIAEAHGGELAVSSVVGKGATFTLTLPVGDGRSA